MIANSLPQKELGSTPMSSTPIEKEPVMECPLLLTTLSGATFKVTLSVAKFDRWVGGWGPRYLVGKRERGPARVPRLVGRTVRL